MNTWPNTVIRLDEQTNMTVKLCTDNAEEQSQPPHVAYLSSD